MKATLKAAIFAMLYGAAAISATPAAADITPAEAKALMDARTGDMKKLVVHKAPRAAYQKGFETESGAVVGFDRFAGKVTLVNFWATWCPPCRKEMPSISRLRADMAGDGFEVIAIALDRAGPEKIEQFFQSIGADNLKIYREPTLRLGAEAGILGMPVTVILDTEGREIARLQGEAEWDAPEAKDMIARIIAALESVEG